MHDGFEAEWPGSRSLATEIVLNVVRTGMSLHARVDAQLIDYLGRLQAHLNPETAARTWP